MQEKRNISLPILTIVFALCAVMMCPSLFGQSACGFATYINCNDGVQSCGAYTNPVPFHAGKTNALWAVQDPPACECIYPNYVRGGSCGSNAIIASFQRQFSSKVRTPLTSPDLKLHSLTLATCAGDTVVLGM